MAKNLREEQTNKAIEIMGKIDIYKPYIEKFKKDGTVTLYEEYAGFYIEDDNEKELFAKIKEIEAKHGCLVYAVTHEHTMFGECYDLLIITKYKNEWRDLLCYSSDNKHVVFAYVWNKDDEWCSEFGDITVKSFGGGIRRVA